LTGQANQNSLLDTRVHYVIFVDGAVDKYFTNSIIESLIEHSCGNGECVDYIQENLDHRKFSDVITTKNCNNNYTHKNKKIVRRKDGIC